MMLRNKAWLIPKGMFSRQKAGRRGRVSHCFCCISDICKATAKMLLAGKWSEITDLFSRISSKRVRQLPETHQGVVEACLQKIKYGLEPKGSFLLKVNFSLP